MSDKDGGPAFPVALPGFAIGDECRALPEYVSGMSLRDYFAAKVLPALWGRVALEPNIAESMAQSAYLIADAMLEARKS